MIRNLHVYFRLEAKCFALSYKTPLGTGRNGSKRRQWLFAMKKHTILVFLLLIVCTMWRGGRGAAFSCPNCTWSMRWSAMVWDIIFIAQSSNPRYSSLLLFSSRCSLHSAPAKFQFVPLGRYCTRYFCCYCSASSGLTSIEIDKALCNYHKRSFLTRSKMQRLLWIHQLLSPQVTFQIIQFFGYGTLSSTFHCFTREFIRSWLTRSWLQINYLKVPIWELKQCYLHDPVACVCSGCFSPL